MLALSINEVIFILFSFGMIGFSSLAVVANDTRSSIINLLIACVFVCGYIAQISDMVISATIIIIYISMLSLFLTMTYEQKPEKSHIDTYIVAIILMLFIITLLLYKHNSIKMIAESRTSHYVGTIELTLIVSLLFLFVLSGIVSLCGAKQKKHKKN